MCVGTTEFHLRRRKRSNTKRSISYPTKRVGTSGANVLSLHEKGWWHSSNSWCSHNFWSLELSTLCGWNAMKFRVCKILIYIMGCSEPISWNTRHVGVEESDDNCSTPRISHYLNYWNDVIHYSSKLFAFLWYLSVARLMLRNVYWYFFLCHRLILYISDILILVQFHVVTTKRYCCSQKTGMQRSTIDM